jgi:hypothetical protein
MMPPIQETLERVAKSKGLEWKEFAEELKKKGQWHVEVSKRRAQAGGGLGWHLRDCLALAGVLSGSRLDGVK